VKIYLAARFSRRDELQHYALTLALLGHQVTSRWHAAATQHRISDEQLAAATASLDDLRLGRQYAREDVADVAAAELLIAFTEAPRSVSSRGGRHVEYGLALALCKPVWIVGPRENVFHSLADGLFATWPEAVRGLALVCASGLEPSAAGRWGWIGEAAAEATHASNVGQEAGA